MTAWLDRQIQMDLHRDFNLARFALSVTAKALVLACTINALAHCALEAAGLLPYPLGEALVVGFVTTAKITVAVTLFLTLTIGQAIRKLAIQRNAFEHLSSTDALSGVRNRRAFFEEFEGATQDGALILIDIDRFKAINDTYGHPAGDAVIEGVGHTLTAVFAGLPAIIGRVGGEEFAVFLPAIAGSRADHAEAARAAVAAMVVAGVEGPVTVSLGVAACRPARPAIETYAAADRALYLAKAGGRNRTAREADLSALARLQEPRAAGDPPGDGLRLSPVSA
ncbi:GGDEF domain-containing protein [Fulvimarina endophytica]|nr:GGDEF domain-containing protein [Fulvimarina endophytica]